MTTAAPEVTFLVPCYKLGHLLAQCVDSILTQDFRRLEILILDDCSPDDTPEVAARYDDPRVKYIRNETNLGHLRNYNKGIALAQGKYIWLISADDRLRSPRILSRYIAAMDRNPAAGFVFCPGVGLLHNGTETKVLGYSRHGSDDRVFRGHRFFLHLLKENSVLAAAGMVRRECYQRLGMFPLDMPYAGDWYLWLLFSLHYDVAYLAEPMVNYREHPLSMTNQLMHRDSRILINDDMSVLWGIRQAAEDAGSAHLIRAIDGAIADRAVRFLKTLGAMRLEEFVDDLASRTDDPEHRRSIQALVHCGLADDCLSRGDNAAARRHYEQCLALDMLQPAALAKYAMLRAGSAGKWLRSVGAFLSRRLRET